MTIEHSPFAPPTTGDAPAAPPFGLPTLPRAATPTIATPTPAPAPFPAPTLPSPTTAPSTPLSTPPLAPLAATTPDRADAPNPKRSRTPLIVLAGLTVATIAGAAWFSMSSADDNPDDASSPQSNVLEPTSPADPDSAPPNQLDLAPQDVSSPIVVPIDDATEVVAQVDDNSAEADALDLLGLDETGNVVAAGHRFTWSSGSGDTTTITVDATTGDYAFESSDGFEWRLVDGTPFIRRGDLEWSQAESDTRESAQRLGLDGPVTVEQILDPLTAEYASSVMTQPDGGTTSMSAEIDAYGLWSDYPDERRIWLGLMGIPNAEDTVEPGEVIVVTATMAADGRTVNTFTVTTPEYASTYTLDQVFETAPVIAAPL